jgi:hypothetical protein
MFIDPKCRELIKDLRPVHWKRDSAGNPIGELDKSEQQRTHLSDAFSYLVDEEFGPGSSIMLSTASTRDHAEGQPEEERSFTFGKRPAIWICALTI